MLDSVVVEASAREKLLLESGRGSTGAGATLHGGTGRLTTAAPQGPIFTQRRAITDFHPDSRPGLIQLRPERIRLVESKRTVVIVVRDQDVHRFLAC